MSGATLATVREIALGLPGTSEKPSYGTPGFRVRDRLFARLLEDEVSLAVFTTFDERAALAAAAPGTYGWTPHYERYPMVLVQLPAVAVDELRELLVEAWRIRASARERAALDAASERSAPGAEQRD